MIQRPQDESRLMVRVPVALVWRGNTPLVTLSEIPLEALDRPFLDDAARAGRIVGTVGLGALALHDDDLRVAGAIHHLWRCGSTLLCRQFAALPRVIALSEPFVFQQLLEGPTAPAARTRLRLRQLAALFRDGTAAHADRLVIKWPGGLAQHAATIAHAFPEVPMLFLYRDPVEILASIAREPLGRRRHGHLAEPELLAVAVEAITQGCRAAVGVSGLRRLDYRELPEASWLRLASYFGFTLSKADIAAMQTAAGPHSKTPNVGRFHPDGATKRAGATAEIHRLAETAVRPALDRLLAHTPALV